MPSISGETIRARLQQFSQDHEGEYDNLRQDIAMYIVGKTTIAFSEKIVQKAAPWYEGQTMEEVYEEVSNHLRNSGLGELETNLIAGVGAGALKGWTFDELHDGENGSVVWREHGYVDPDGAAILDDKIILHIARALACQRDISEVMEECAENIIHTDNNLSDFSEEYHEPLLVMTKSIMDGTAISDTETAFIYQQVTEAFGG